MRRIAFGVLLWLLRAGIAGAQTIETVAGGGPNNMPALNANIAYPEGVVTDGAGNFYIVSRDLNRVFRVDTQGQLTGGFSGDGGPVIDASLYPVAVTMDASGNLYIADGDNNRVRKVDTLGTITTVAGNGTWGYGGDGGPAVDASLSSPQDVAVDASGNLYIVDTWNNRVRKVDTSGIRRRPPGTHGKPVMRNYS